ncbi:UNKNOWN [Stylonychia lemnae]|uniref:Uncharacterized protein n=1 Tax=Stylonychia lemnae TaxID=5949 RepID=A0A078APU4_STYLE|nr:UNKNOWN [Stylonychia lemnae]|eukprot:CDW82958.1 UNKNOWN [Stylonychia lemnae]
MLLIVVCVFLIAISKNFTVQRHLIEEPLTVFVPIFFALIQVAVQTISTVIIRKSSFSKYQLRAKYPIILRFYLQQALLLELQFQPLPKNELDDLGNI